jgi:sec-independent protein translocase protein TatA
MLAGFFDSPAEIGIILLVVLLLFGGSQLPKLAKNIGKAQKEFKDGLSEGQKKAAAGDDAAPTETPKVDGQA